jgi:hypothetical protein
MKNYFSLAVACIAVFLCSCKKEDLNDGTIINSPTSSGTSAAAATIFKPNKMVNYGALISAPSTANTMNFQLSVANKIGISCLRVRVIVPSTNKVPILNQGYKILLNFNKSDYTGTPLPFVSDLTKYQSDLKKVLSGFTSLPAVAVIENEESNLLYYSGTAQEYIKQLSAAIPVMHAYGIKVANGGITSTGLNYLVYQDFINRGKVDSAKDFQQRTHLAVNNAQTLNRGAFIDALLQAYTKMDLDYVNFHWKGTSPDIQALNAVINYLKKRTGKTIINNELGQFDTDPNTLLSLVQLCTDKGFPYIIWYSPDENAGKKDTPLQHSDQSLTTTGIAFKNYLQN